MGFPSPYHGRQFFDCTEPSTLPPSSCTLSLSGTENLYQVDWSNVGKEKKEMIFKKYPREP